MQANMIPFKENLSLRKWSGAAYVISCNGSNFEIFQRYTTALMQADWRYAFETAIWKLKRKITDFLIKKLENSSTSVNSNKF